jgi:hypothetical protein
MHKSHLDSCCAEFERRQADSCELCLGTKGQAANMLAKKQLPTPQKRSTHSEPPEQTALQVANAVWLSLRMIGTDTPCSKKTDARG